MVVKNGDEFHGRIRKKGHQNKQKPLVGKKFPTSESHRALQLFFIFRGGS